MGQISYSVTIHHAEKVCQQQTRHPIGPIRKLWIKWSDQPFWLPAEGFEPMIFGWQVEPATTVSPPQAYTREVLLKGQSQYVNVLVLTGLDVAALDSANIVYFITECATFMRSSMVLSFPLKLGFPAYIDQLKCPFLVK